MTRGAPDPRDVQQPRARLDVRKHSFAVRVTEKWNALSSETKSLENLKAFKNAIRKSSSGIQVADHNARRLR